MNGDTPRRRGDRIAAEVLSEILPRLARGEGPVDLRALARRVEEEIMEALLESPLFAEGQSLT